jgi:DNA repair exonuclease SbcCD ATPase subunit
MILFAAMVFTSSAWSQGAFTQKDRETLIELKAIVSAMNKRFDQVNKRMQELREDMDKRFEQVDKRFEQVDKRFEQVDKRFEQVDKRFEQVDKRFEQVDKRFEQVVRGFEQVDNRFEDIKSRFAVLMDYILILVTIFGVITAIIVGFALWDRRSIVRPLEAKVVELDKKVTGNRSSIERLTDFLKKYALKNKRVDQLLHQMNIL